MRDDCDWCLEEAAGGHGPCPICTDLERITKERDDARKMSAAWKAAAKKWVHEAWERGERLDEFCIDY